MSDHPSESSARSNSERDRSAEGNRERTAPDKILRQTGGIRPGYRSADRQSQLDQLGKDAKLCAVIERRPSRRTEWMVGYVSYLGIGLIWKNDQDDRLNCTDNTRKLLRKLIPKISKPDFSP